MARWGWIGAVVAVCFAAASCGGGGDATCGVCGTAFTNSDCQRFAMTQGCATGVAEPDPVCGSGTMQCRFTGCPGHAIECAVPDAGP